ncbi:MAG: hypothetical protein D6782_12410 [Alphaproteobacteria bacterium]|nr:MAG: hypothetical protein D6782_12410 [Alphaproteobacteria bacterium]
MAAVSPPVGCAVTLSHPALGTIGGQIADRQRESFAIAFPASERAVLFALKALALAMTQAPAAAGRAAAIRRHGTG